MSEPSLIQIDYEQVQAIAQRMQARAEQCGELCRQVRRAAGPLQAGGWEGRGSSAFFGELEGEILPAVERLELALRCGHELLVQSIAIFKAAEEQAARHFGGQGDGGSTKTLHVNVTGKTQRAMSSSEVFSQSYMDAMIERTWQGQGSGLLATAMDKLLDNPSPEDRDRALATIAEVRGLDPNEVRTQYEKFRHYQRECNEKFVDDKIEPLYTGLLWKSVLHDNHMGSQNQLRFGQIVGDRLGIDPVFGAMLNPTGGLPGSNNAAVAVPHNGIMYHSAFHDAGGFLSKLTGDGPGYDYLNRENRPKDNPWTGQESGLRYWNDKFGDKSILSKASSEVGVFMGRAVDVDVQVKTLTDQAGRQLSEFYDLIF